jgi:hypothetical protein
MFAAALVAAALLWLTAWGTSKLEWRALGGVLGAALGWLVGCWVLGVELRWPPREDQHRLLLVLVPALVGVELMAALARSPWLAWPGRLLVAAGAAPILLHGSVYLTEAAGPGSREWTPTEIGLILGLLAIALGTVWAGLVTLARRDTGQSVLVPLAVVVLGAGITVMLSGYASGGQVAFPLAAALVAVVLASLFLSAPARLDGVVGLGVVGLFALVVMGRFFGNLSTTHAALLLLAPLLCWLAELPYVARAGPRLRATLVILLTAVPVIAAVLLAYQQSNRDALPSAANDNEPSAQDYLDFGK